MSDYPTNTTRSENRPDWLLGGNPRAIEAQEARGQRELVESTVLPTECRPADKAALEAAGVKFGDPLPGDPIFCNAELPEGWKKEGSDHAMWSYLVDETGTQRAAIFYKAAFYDRSAFIRLA